MRDQPPIWLLAHTSEPIATTCGTNLARRNSCAAIVVVVVVVILALLQELSKAISLVTLFLVSGGVCLVLSLRVS